MLGLTEEEPAAGGGVVLGVSCAIAGNSQCHREKDGPVCATREERDTWWIDSSMDPASGWSDATMKAGNPIQSATDSDGHSWGIKLSRGKFNAPESENAKGIDFESEC